MYALSPFLQNAFSQFTAVESRFAVDIQLELVSCCHISVSNSAIHNGRIMTHYQDLNCPTIHL